MWLLWSHALRGKSDQKQSRMNSRETAKKCWSLQQSASLLPGSPASPTKKTTEADMFSSQASMFSSLSEAASGWVQGQVDKAQETSPLCSSDLQLFTSTEGQRWQSSHWCLHQMSGMDWQSTHAGESSLPEAACSTWRPIKPAWCRVATVNRPGKERQSQVLSNEAFSWLSQWVLKKSGWGLGRIEPYTPSSWGSAHRDYLTMQCKFSIKSSWGYYLFQIQREPGLYLKTDMQTRPTFTYFNIF